MLCWVLQFHQAGTAKAGMTDGVPRMKELTNASKKMSTPWITAPLVGNLGREAAELLARSLPHTLLRNILNTGTRVLYEPVCTATAVPADAALIAQHRPFLQHVHARTHAWVIRFELDRTLAGARSLEPRGVADCLQTELGGGALVLASRANDPVWVIRVYLLDTDSVVTTATRDSLQSGSTRTGRKRASQRASLSAHKRRKFADFSLGLNSNGEPLADHVTDDGTPEVGVPLHCIDAAVGRRRHTARQAVEQLLARNTMQALMRLRVCGLERVQAAQARQQVETVFHPHTGAAEQRMRWVVDVQGTDVEAVSLLTLVDRPNVVTNNVMAVAKLHGVDAAANVMYHELVACLASSGSRVDDRLIRLLVDIATHNGFVMPINRFGLNRLLEHGVLAKITFEEVIDVLTEAAAFGLRDELRGVSEKIMLGRKPTQGTGFVKLYADGPDGRRLPVPDRFGGGGGARVRDADEVNVVVSVVPEGDEDRPEAADHGRGAGAAAMWEAQLSQALTSSGGAREQVQAATAATLETMGSQVSHDLYYGSHYYYQPPLVQEAIAEDGPHPFRPPSPTLLMDVGHDEVVGGVPRAFCPLSPGDSFH